MKYQDAHTHFFSRPFFDALAAQAPFEGEPAELLEAVAQDRTIDLPSDDVGALRDRWLQAMDAAEVARMVTFASLPVEAEAVAAAAAASQGRLIPFTVVNPTDSAAPGFVKRAVGEWGMRGFVLFPAMHHYFPGDPRCAPIYEAAAANKMPVVVHCGMLKVPLRDAFGLPRTFDLAYSSPLSVIPVADRYPDVPFVIPHFGAGMFRETLMAGMQCENIYVDTSSSNNWLATQPGPLTLADVFRHALVVFGPSRILFGTDSGTFPRGYRTDLRDAQLNALNEIGTTPAQVAAIMGGNLARLFPGL